MLHSWLRCLLFVGSSLALRRKSSRSRGGYTGVAENPAMLYSTIMDISIIKQYQPQCDGTFGDEDEGRQLPDSCCDPESWKDAQGNLPPGYFPPEKTSFTKGDDPKNWTCFLYPGIGEAFADQFVRLHIGCEDGEVMANENCIPAGLEYVTPAQFKSGQNWQFPMNADVAAATWVDGTSETCRCQNFMRGTGCFIASNKMARFSGMFPGVFLKVEGTCPPVNAPEGYTGVAENPAMLYSSIMDPTLIKQFQPACDGTFGDEDEGRQVPDSCCDPESWMDAQGNMIPDYNPPSVTPFTMGDDPKNWTCYRYGGIGVFVGQWIRLHIGCEDGELEANENCIPPGLDYVTQAQFDAGPGNWNFPMTTEVAAAAWFDGTSSQCYCQNSFKGAGCFIASNKMARFGGMFPAVFVNVKGTCRGTSHPAQA